MRKKFAVLLIFLLISIFCIGLGIAQIQEIILLNMSGSMGESDPPSGYNYVFVVEGTYGYTPGGLQTKLVKRNRSDLSLVSSTSLGDYTASGIGSMPGIAYIPGGRFESPGFNFTINIDGAQDSRIWGHVFLSKDASSFYTWFGGPDASDSPRTLFEKRNISDGSLVWQRYYTGAGVGINNYVQVYLYNGNLYAIGPYQSNGFRIEKFTENNVNVWSFTELTGGPYNGGGAIYADSSGVYIGYTRNISGSQYWRIEKRLDQNPPNVVWTQDRAIGPQRPYKISSDDTGENIIIIGGKGSAIYEKRSKIDGSLIASGGYSVGSNSSAFDMDKISNETVFFTAGYDYGGGVSPFYEPRVESVSMSNMSTNYYNVTFGGINNTCIASGVALGSNKGMLLIVSFDYSGSTNKYRYQKRKASSLGF